MSSNNQAKRESRRLRIVENSVNASADENIEYKAANRSPIKPLTSTQSFHISALLHDDLVVAIGSAGTGKTYLASAVAADLYQNGMYKKIVVTRPNIEVGKSLGFLPGEIDDKYAPYVEPFKKGLIDRLGSNKFKCDFKSRILAKPMQYMRGETFDDTIILLDEAQNITIVEMKMILTRVGQNSKIFITGDVNQSDIPQKESGLAWLVRRLKERQSSYEVIEYRRSDCVRSGFCKEMLDLIELE